MAMKRFDAMVDGFSDAMDRAKSELKQQGFEQVEQISEQIKKRQNTLYLKSEILKRNRQ